MKHKYLLLPLILLFSISYAIASPRDTLIEKANFPSGSYEYQGFKSLTVKPLQVWPNPAQDWVRISVNTFKPGDVGECVLYNSNGVVAKRQTISNGTNELNTANLQTGMYFVQIISRNKDVSTDRIIVRH